MWLYVADRVTGGITDCRFNYGYYNSGGGRYYIYCGRDSWVYTSAPGYVSAWAYSDNYESAAMYLDKSTK